MDKIGLLDSITQAMESIAEGRRGWETEGSTEAGRVSYRDGLAEAMAAFKQAAESADARILILVDHAYVTQERQFCDSQDAEAIGSMAAAVTGFDDALRVLPTVSDAMSYQAVETSYPHNTDYRYKGMPKDAFHIACKAHRARLTNTLRAPGLSMTEKALYKLRKANMSAAQGVYFAMQQTVLEV
jgi:hypothetical protein